MRAEYIYYHEYKFQEHKLKETEGVFTPEYDQYEHKRMC